MPEEPGAGSQETGVGKLWWAFALTIAFIVALVVIFTREKTRLEGDQKLVPVDAGAFFLPSFDARSR